MNDFLLFIANWNLNQSMHIEVVSRCSLALILGFGCGIKKKVDEGGREYRTRLELKIDWHRG